ncbi:MAG: hypothetical protein J6P81_07385 [Spirochaetales bacterium]|nr:hypothetical protein [Spirochaetales bacterium]MBO6048705.1 hypothetical protein [Spirochaetales bacterium]MBO7349360.1 hypothetical protein [Spirochaetales bacterium]MBP5756134.1 hypothetical protein [Spirochaetales bacterium]
MKEVLIGLGVGLVIAIIVYIWQKMGKGEIEKKSKQEIARLKNLLADRMDIESEGVTKLRKENEELKKANENLRITNANLAQKPGRAEVQRLHIYQQAVDRLVINSPGFGAAWQSALKESEEEFAKTYTGTQAFWKKVLPGKTNAKLISNNDVVDEQ